MLARLRAPAALIATATLVLATSWAHAAAARTEEGSSLSLEPVAALGLSDRTKAVTGFAIGSLAGLLLGGRKRKTDEPAA